MSDLTQRRWIVHVYDEDGTTLLETLDTARDISGLDDLTGPGSLTFTFDAEREKQTDLIQVDRWVKLYDSAYNAERFAAVVRSQTKQRLDATRSQVTVECDGLRGLFKTARVFPDDFGIAAYGRGARLFGWHHPTLYDDAAWTTPASHGTHGSDPFGDGRPTDWPAPTAEYLWNTGSLGTDAAGDVFFRRAFTTTTAQDVVVCCTADDEFDLFLDGVPLLSSRGAYQWQRFFQTALSLPAGDHVLAVRGRNFQRNGSNSVGWVLFAIVAADPSGQPLQTDETWEVDHGGATGGTFTLNFDSYGPTAAIAWNASAAAVESALEALVASIDVSVSGTGTIADPWVIVCDGDDIQGVGHTITGDGSGLTGGGAGLTLVNTVDGAWADVVVKSDTTDTVMLAYPATNPGVTFGAILGELVGEAQARGSLAGLSESYTATLDSEGSAWPSQVEVGFSLGADYEDVLGALEEAGLDVHFRPDGTIDASEDLGDDLSATVTLTWGANVVEAVHTRDGDRTDRWLIETVDGFTQDEVASPDVPEREQFVIAGAFPTPEAYQLFLDQLIADNTGEADNGNFQLAGGTNVIANVEAYGPDGTTVVPQPWADFDVADTIGATDWQRAQTRQRVLGVEFTVTDAGMDWRVQTTDTGVAVTYPAIVVAAAPLRYWRLDDTSGSTAVDTMGNGDATYVNTPTLATAGLMDDGQSANTSVTFDRTVPEYVTAGDVAGLEFTGRAPFSVEAWVRLDSLVAVGAANIASKLDGPPFSGWVLQAESNGSALRFESERWVSGSSEQASQSSFGDMAVGSVYHVVMTYDGATQRLYVNGVLAEAEPDTSSLPATSAAVLVGSSAAAAAWDGAVDEVAIYDRALTATEVALHYQVGTLG